MKNHASSNMTKGVALFVATMSSFVTTFVGSSLHIALPSIGKEFALDAVMGSVEKKFYGVASGTLGTMRIIGQVLSMGIAMMLFALYIGRVQITPEYYPFFLESFQTAFIIFAVLCFGGIFASLARGKVR